MKILAGWDDPAEAELLQLYLTGGEDNQIFVTTAEAPLLEAANDPSWDVVLLTLTFPATAEEGMAVYVKLQEAAPDLPIVLACRPSEIIQLPRFLLRGLRFYLYRDAQGDFMFLVISVLESALTVARAERAQRLADQLRQEIEGVRLLQEAIIPRGLTPPPGYRIAARYEPAQVTVMGGKAVVLAGGDYYDLFCPDGRTLTTLMGDASGHGLKACMAIMTMHTLVRMLASEGYRDTAAFVSEINKLLCENSIVQSGGGFITLLYASIDTESHKVSWTSAGHPPPLLQRLDTGEITQVGTNNDGGPPLGITTDLPYDAMDFVLPPRSRLLIYTDGLTDALPEDGNDKALFGVDGIHQALRNCAHRDIEAAVDHLFQASNAYTGGRGRHDDTSVLLLERYD